MNDRNEEYPAIERRARVGDCTLCADLYTHSSDDRDHEMQFLCPAVVGRIDPCTLSFPLRSNWHEIVGGSRHALRFLPPGLQIRVQDGTGYSQTLTTRWGDVEVARICQNMESVGTWHLMRAYDEPDPFVGYPSTKAPLPWGSDLLWGPGPPAVDTGYPGGGLPAPPWRAWMRDKNPGSQWYGAYG